MAMTDNYWAIGEFARRVGVSVRTLQYYDKIDLLKPTAYSQTGRRLYSESDIRKLQQIVTLKFIGLSLDDIRELFTTDSIAVDELIYRQKLALKEKIRQLQQIITTIETAENMLCKSEHIDLEHAIDIIREVRMSNQTDWLKQFFTDTQQTKISDLIDSRGLDAQREEGQALQQLFMDIESYLAGDTDDDISQELATRWQQLIQAHVQGDDDLQTAIETAYSHIGTFAESMGLSEELRVWMRSMQDASVFITKQS